MSCHVCVWWGTLVDLGQISRLSLSRVLDGRDCSSFSLDSGSGLAELSGSLFVQFFNMSQVLFIFVMLRARARGDPILTCAFSNSPGGLIGGSPEVIIGIFLCRIVVRLIFRLNQNIVGNVYLYC